MAEAASPILLGMTYKSVAVAVFVAVAVLTAVDAVIVYQLQDPVKFAGHLAVRVLALAAAAAGAAMTAARFNWFGEYVGRAWTLLFVLYALLTMSDLLNRLKLGAPAVADVLVIVANLAAIGAFWLFGRALQNAGLQFFGPAAAKVVVFLGAVAVACALVLPTIVEVVREDLGAIDRVSQIVSAAADMLTFILVAPLLLTVWSFRGGQLSWVYGFLALSTIGWMINQAADDLLPKLLVRDAQMAGFFIACASVAAAAYAQRTTARAGAAHA